jgi:hypothetical protein
MTDADTLQAAMTTAKGRDAWLATMDDAGEEAGYFQWVGNDHFAYFADNSRTLLVGFETVDSAMARPEQLPTVNRIGERNGWSHLTLLANAPNYWRNPAVFAYIDRLVDDAFFEDFDHVLFYGAGAAGHAAAAYSVAAPGSTVLLLSPRATMAPAIAGWDNRDRAARALDFTSRYGFAPDMVDGAAQVFLAYDPLERLDAMHAALFRAAHIMHLPLPRAGAQVESTLQRLGVLDEMIESAAKGALTRGEVARAWRKRRDDAAYLKSTLTQAAHGHHPEREKMVCRSVTQRLKLPKFTRRLAELETPTD